MGRGLGGTVWGISRMGTGDAFWPRGLDGQRQLRRVFVVWLWRVGRAGAGFLLWQYAVGSGRLLYSWVFRSGRAGQYDDAAFQHGSEYGDAAGAGLESLRFYAAGDSGAAEFSLHGRDDGGVAGERAGFYDPGGLRPAFADAGRGAGSAGAPALRHERFDVGGVRR